jgi:hypothetical protein
METETLLPCSQESSTVPFPKLDQPSPYHPILSEINFDTIYAPRSWSS